VVRPGRFVLCLTLLAGACSGGGDDPGSSATPSAPSSTATSAASPSTTAPADPFAIPEVIDAAYVNRVLAALYGVVGDAVRDVVQNRTTERAVRHIGDVYTGDQLEYELENLVQVLKDDPTIYRQPPGDRRVVVQTLMSTRADCIVALVQSDFTDVVVAPAPQNPAQVGLIALVPASREVQLRGVNPTPWSIAAAQLIARDARPEEATSCV
jgi:hypothetical protein